MQGSILFFSLFLVGILGILIFDLLILGRKSHEVTLREAAIWTGVWVTLSLLFALFLRFHGQLIHGIETHEELKLVLHRFYPYLSAGQGSFAEELTCSGKASR